MSVSDLDRLLQLRPSGEIRWGLRRVRAMLHALGRPHMSFRSVHVGGTNGKGSVAAMVAAILEADGRRVGLYTSPHLVDFGERVRIRGGPAAPDLLESCARRLLPHAQRHGATFFEAATALAFLCFAEADIDFGVAEVGLGGRLDATNVLLPEVTVINQVGWDHADYLGHSMSAIAREKAGICKPGIPVVLGRLEPEAGRIIRRAAAVAGAPVRQLGHDAAVRRVRIGTDATTLEYVSADSPGPLSLVCPLLGAHQAWNAGLAALAVGTLPPPYRPARARVAEGIRSVRWPGRLQIERKRDRTWVLDVAHNPAAVDALAGALTSLNLPEPLAMVIAILGDKPWPEMLPPLLALAETAIFTVAPSSPRDRRWDPRSVARTVPSYRVEVVEDFGAALDRAAGLGATVVVTGSHHTVGDAMLELDVPVGLPRSSALG